MSFTERCTRRLVESVAAGKPHPGQTGSRALDRSGALVLGVQRAAGNRAAARLVLRQRDPRQTASALTLPTASITIRTTGDRSLDNHARLGPVQLGTRVLPGQNVAEFVGHIQNHRPGVEYEFRRTKHVAIWLRENGGWRLMHHSSAGPDDTTNDDEDLSPSFRGLIFSLDTPGLRDYNNHPVPPTRTGFVYAGSFVETIDARLGPSAAWTTISPAFAWHSVTWLTNVSGRWRRASSGNEIGPGAIAINPGRGPSPPTAVTAATSEAAAGARALRRAVAIGRAKSTPPRSGDCSATS